MATLLTKEICTPRDLCCPEQSRQIKDPKDKDAQVGFGAEQSQQALLPGSWRMEAAEARGIWLLIFGGGGGRRSCGEDKTFRGRSFGLSGRLEGTGAFGN